MQFLIDSLLFLGTILGNKYFLYFLWIFSLHNLVQLWRIRTFSICEATVIFSNLGFVPFFPGQKALVIPAETPKYFLSIDYTTLMSSYFLLGLSSAFDSPTL